jgi:type IV secretory pathway protease TraF
MLKMQTARDFAVKMTVFDLCNTARVVSRVRLCLVLYRVDATHTWCLAMYSVDATHTWCLAMYRVDATHTWCLALYRVDATHTWCLALYCVDATHTWCLAVYRVDATHTWCLALYRVDATHTCASCEVVNASFKARLRSCTETPKFWVFRHIAEIRGVNTSLYASVDGWSRVFNI